MIGTCPYCGSHRISTRDGADGNPTHGKAPSFSVCLDCGGRMPGDGDLSALLRAAAAGEGAALSVCATVTRQTAQGETRSEVCQILPYTPGEYDLGKEYPFSKNVYTGPDSGYSFRWLYVKEDLSLRYLDEDPRPALGMGESHVFCRLFGNETVTVTVKADGEEKGRRL